MLQIASWQKPALEVGEIYGANLQPLVEQFPRSSCEVCVIVPVRDEAKNIKATLLALTNQVELNGQPLNKNRYEIIVLANNCSDRSAEIARQFAQDHPDLYLHVVEIVLERDRAMIGWVRKILMDEAYRRLKAIGRDWGIIASTDGDTRVSPTWIAATLAEVKSGADAVGGRIITRTKERKILDHSTRLYFLRTVGYSYLAAQLEAYLDPDTCDPYPRHYQHCGASLAVTAQMYAKVGGLPPLPSSEDIALYDALIRDDARFRHSRSVQVTTSARVAGRAKAGLADRLAELTIMGEKKQSLLVESALLIESRFRLRRHLRSLWQSKKQGGFVSSELLKIMAQFLGLDRELVRDILIKSPTFGLSIEQIGYYQQSNREIELNWQPVTIQQAINDLRARVRQVARLNSYYLKQQEFQYVSKLNSLEQIQPILLLPQPF